MNYKSYPKKTINGRKKAVHRHVMEEFLGRHLDRDEHVYHIDGDHLNNDVENLIVIKKEYQEDL